MRSTRFALKFRNNKRPQTCLEVLSCQTCLEQLITDGTLPVAVAGVDSCFALIRDQHCIAGRPINQQSRISSAMDWCTCVTYSVLRTIVLYNNTSVALGVVKFHQCKLSFLLALSSWCFAIENVFNFSTWRFGFILLSFSLLT